MAQINSTVIFLAYINLVRPPFSHIHAHLLPSLYSSIKMATVHPDDVLLFHGADPYTGILPPFDVKDYNSHQSIQEADMPNTINHYTFPPLDQKLSQWPPAVMNIPHPCELTNSKLSSHQSTNPKKGLFHQLRKRVGCGQEKKSKKPPIGRGEGGWLRSADQHQVVKSVDYHFEPRSPPICKHPNQSLSLAASRAAARIHSKPR